MKALAICLFLGSSLLVSAQQRRGRGPDKAPKVDAPIPAVSAKSPDGKTTVKFANAERLTVLIFGSHT